MLDLRLFADRTYSAAVLTSAFTGAALFGATLLFPLYFQLGRGADPLTSGVLLLSLSIGTVVVLPLSGRLVDRYGGGVVAVAGGIGCVATTLPFAVLPIDAAQPWVQLLLLLRGAAIALAVMPASTAAYAAVSRAQLPDATTQVNIVSRVGGALGGALFAVVLAGRLADGVQPAFQVTFWWLTAASALGLVAAVGLVRAQRRPRDPPRRARAPGVEQPSRTGASDQPMANPAARPAWRPENRQPPRNVPSNDR